MDMMSIPHRTLIVRGDLRSQTGWSRATRALVQLMRPHFTAVFGIDLHFSPTVSVLPAPFRIIGEREVDLLIDAGLSVTVLNMCLPHEFRYVPGAANIGYFFWETDKPPTDWGWIELCGVMDQIWVPTRWQRDLVTLWMANADISKDIRVIPWPHQLCDGPNRSDDPSPRVQVHRILTPVELSKVDAQEAVLESRGRIPWFGSRIAKPARRHYDRMVLEETTSVLDLAALAAPIVFAVQTDIPRKGLAVFISEWLQFRRTHTDVNLLIKLSSINVSRDRSTLHAWLSRLVRRLNARFGVPDVGILVCYERLSDSVLAACYRAASAYVSATYGEGFGGPVVESVLGGTLPIVPAHTACACLLPDKYPLCVESLPVVGRLIGELPLYPASGTWHVPADGSIAEKLCKLFSESTVVRALWLQTCREHLARTLGYDAVATSIADALTALEACR